MDEITLQRMSKVIQFPERIVKWSFLRNWLVIMRRLLTPKFKY